MTNLLLALLPNLLDTNSWDLGNMLGAIGALSGLAGLAVAYYPLHQQRRRQRLLESEFGADLYQPAHIENAARYYVRPYSSSVDPAQEGEMRRVFVTKEDLFSAIDRYITDDTAHRHILLLADAGMGKSSFVLSYYARNQQMPKRKRHRLAVIPLGRPEAVEEIKRIDDQRHTVLFLDSFDEDTKAIQDYRARLRELMEASSRFKRVLITCRTQFFHKDDEIPQQTGIARVDPRKPGETGVYEFWKLYILPLDDEQVDKYLRRRYPIWASHKRKQARAAVNKVPLLSVRPMLLAYVPDLLETKDVAIDFPVQLYEQMVRKWIEREWHWFKDYDLLTFSKELAVDLYVQSAQRQAERISRDELGALLQAYPIPIDEWKITGRSLLNRDGSGNYKFAHRSIMEYLFVCSFLEGDARCRDIKWTDLMKQFLLEAIYIHYRGNNSKPLDLTGADLTDTEGNYIPPLYCLRSAYMTDAQLGPGLPHGGANAPPALIHVFAQQHRSEGNLVTDHATGLTWQRGGSERMLRFTEAAAYVANLNSTGYCGYNDWRLPTADELVLTMTGEGASDARFDEALLTIWTGDKTARGDAIHLAFAQLRAQAEGSKAYARAVRTVTKPSDQIVPQARYAQPRLLAPAV